MKPVRIGEQVIKMGFANAEKDTRGHVGIHRMVLRTRDLQRELSDALEKAERDGFVSIYVYGIGPRTLRKAAVELERAYWERDLDLPTRPETDEEASSLSQSPPEGPTGPLGVSEALEAVCGREVADLVAAIERARLLGYRIEVAA